MVVSRNRCTPKSSTSIGFSIMNKPFWVPPCLETSKQSSWYLIALFDEVSGRSCCFEDICGKPNDSWMDGQTIPNHDRFTALEWPNDPCSAGPYRPTNTVTKQTSQFLLSKYMSIWCALFADSIPDNSPLTCMKLWFFRSSTVNICHILKSYSIFEYLQMCFFQTMFGHCFFLFTSKAVVAVAPIPNRHDRTVKTLRQEERPAARGRAEAQEGREAPRISSGNCVKKWIYDIPSGNLIPFTWGMFNISIFNIIEHNYIENNPF